MPPGEELPLERNTIVIDQREGLWRLRMYPDKMQLFRSRELAEAHAQELACSQVPPWTVIVREENDHAPDPSSKEKR
jgi:hypothetical protein